MQLTYINPYMRYVALHPCILESEQLSVASDCRLFYIVEGHGFFIRQDQTDLLSPATVIYVRSGIPYQFSGKMKVFVINFDLTREKEEHTEPIPPHPLQSFRKELLLENEPPAELEGCLIGYHAEHLESRFRDALACRRFGSAYSDMQSSAIIKELLCMLLQLGSQPESKKTELAQQVTLYIQKNYDKDLHNGEIAAEFGYHPFYLNRVFREEMGQTIHQALLGERVRIAKKLLLNTDLPIEQIADEAGFCDRSQFGVTFKRATGYSPAAYRARFRLIGSF